MSKEKPKNKPEKPLFKVSEPLVDPTTLKPLKPSQIVIIGGGKSINEGISKGLWDKLKGKWTIGLNYSYKYFKSTIQCFVDDLFYKIGDKGLPPEERIKHEQALEKLPLIIGKFHNGLKYHSNTIPLDCKPKYDRDIKKGIYKESLVGLFALSLAIYLLDDGEIFLLGYDFGGIGKDKRNREITHFYQGKIEHRGIGKVNYYYAKNRAKDNFAPYEQEKRVKIYNVSMESRIPTFPKISYEEFFSKLKKQNPNQAAIREYIKEKLKEENNEKT